ncbi:alpha/beta hydrolase [Gemmatimonas sp.]|uniref:alpha/beta fold hydrolase n=1 Tax=Gemmatimonas sp. TaxID=1962908 RepID=UPI00286C1062|nr:alpha/beta hydrolase [Gemmatimonas sp.]
MRGEFVDLRGVRLYCYAFGERGVGEPIVLIHGAFTSSHLWQDVLPRLPKGHRVLVLDLLGHGRSDPPGTHPMTVAGHATRVAALLDVLGVRRASLVGHGMGAAIAAVVAHEHPERVAHLLLVNPTMIGCQSGDVALSRRVARLVPFLPLWRRLSPGWLASALHSALLPCYAHRDVGARSLDLYLKSFRTRDGRGSAIAQLSALAASRGDTTAALAPGAITCPVLLATATADPFVPTVRAVRLGEALRLAAPNGVELRELPGVAHVAPEEAPDRLGALVAELLTR